MEFGESFGSFVTVAVGSASSARLVGSGCRKFWRGRPATPAARLPQDANVNPKPPTPKQTNRPSGLSAAQNAQAQADIAAALAQGATDVLVNQHQVNANRVRVGVNRPDVQYTLNGKRYYIEYDLPPGRRAAAHRQRILANDPHGIVILK